MVYLQGLSIRKFSTKRLKLHLFGEFFLHFFLQKMNLFGRNKVEMRNTFVSFWGGQKT